MKYIRNMLLILIILAFWSETALCSRIWPWAQDQHGNILENSAHTSQQYGGTACNATPTWYSPGHYTYEPSWTGCATCWAIETGLWSDWPGYMEWPTKVCGDRYTFKSLSGAMSGDGYRDSVWKPVLYTETAAIQGMWDGISPGAIYDRNALVIQRTVVDYASPVDSAYNWLPVGSNLPALTAPNREAQNQFYYAVYNHGSWGSQTVVTPTGVVAEMGGVTSATPYSDHYIDWQYLNGNKMNMSNNLTAPIKLPNARTAHTATLLKNGKILVVGGRDDVNSVLYDLSSDSWSNVPTAFNSYYHAATLLPNGKVLVTGGSANATNSYQSALTTARLFDPAANSWSSAAPMTTARINHSATILPNGKVLVAGGENAGSKLGSVEIYDPATDSWSNGTNMPGPRFGAAAILLPTNNRVLVSGGHDGTNYLNSALLYDPLADSWSTTTNLMTAARYGHSIALSGENVLLVGGTLSNMGTTERYYPPNNSFYSDGQGTLIAGRYFSAAVTLPDGKVLVIGGSNGTPLDSAELFEGMTNKTGQYNVQLNPTFSTTAPRTAPFTGTKWVARTDLSMTANNQTAAREDALWIPAGWSGGTGRAPASGSSGTVNFTTIYNDSAINLAYQKHYRTTVTIDSSLDAWIRDSFKAAGSGYKVQNASGNAIAPIVANGTEYWTPAASSTILIPEKISRIASNGVEELWVLDKNALVLPAWATLTYDAALRQYKIQQGNQFKSFNYAVTYKNLSVGVSGVADSNLQKLQSLEGFVPRPSATSLTLGLADLTLSAPNVIYAEDAGIPNAIKYILRGWSGTGSIPASGVASSGTNTTIPAAITANSSIIWNYGKQIRVTVTTSGEKNPLLVKDLPGDTTITSDMITNISTYWDDAFDEFGNPAVDGDGNPVTVRKSLQTGMLVVGNGIAEGTTIAALDTTWVRLSVPATLTYTADNGQRLTFATLRANALPADTTGGSYVVGNVDTTGLMAGMSVSGPGIEDGTTIATVDSASQLTLSNIASLTLTAANGQRLAFGSADPRECQTNTDFTPANCPVQSAVNFYSFDTSTTSAEPFDQVRMVSLTTRNQFVEVVDGLLQTRTFNQVVYTQGASLNETPQVSGARQVLTVNRLLKPMDVSWRYNSTKVFRVGEPIKPPTDVADILYDTPPTINIPNGNVSTSFVLAWDTSMSSYQPVGDIVTGSAVISNMSSTVGLTVGMYVYADGIPAMTKVLSVAAGQVTIDTNATMTKTFSDTDRLTFQSRQGERYFPIQPVTSFELLWTRRGTAIKHSETGTAVWPVKQTHVAGVPANLNPPGAANTFREVSYPPGSTVINGVFKPDLPGTSVLRFNTPPVLPDLQAGAAFIVVDTTLLRPEQYPDTDVPIGSKITYGAHSDPEGKTGYVFYPGAVHDAVGQDRAYDRETRTGAIIPVNKSVVGSVNPLVVVWYKIGHGDIGWPTTPKRYNAFWPASSDPSLKTITIGSGVSVPLTEYPRAMVYIQPDKSQAGFNPNEEHALLKVDSLYALRDDLNKISNLSEPYVLLKYKNKQTQEWAMEVYKVDRPDSFSFTYEAGKALVAPLPAGQIPPVSDIKLVAPGTDGREWHFKDHNKAHYAKAANWKEGDTIDESAKSRFVMQWYYYMRSDFYWPDAVGFTAKVEGDALPFLHYGPKENMYQEGDAPVDVTYITKWPASAPALAVGDTLTTARDGLPDLRNFMVTEVVFDENLYKGAGPLAKLYAPERYLYAPLAALPAKLKKETVNGIEVFPELPFALQERLFYDPARMQLGFKGAWISSEGETPWLLPNLMTGDEKTALKTGLKAQTGVDCATTPDNAWCAAIDTLHDRSRNPNSLNYQNVAGANIINPFNDALTYSKTADPQTGKNPWETLWGIPLGLQMNADGKIAAARSIVGEKNALTAGMAQGEGYLVIAVNNSDDSVVRDLPVSLEVIRVVKAPVFRGVIKAIKPKSVFDEKLTLHYTGDFGGEPENFYFEWFYQPVTGRTSLPGTPDKPAEGAAVPPWEKFNDPVNTTGKGQTDITIQGASALTMSDNWVAARYYYKHAWPAVAVPSDPSTAVTPQDDSNNWSSWSGANFSEPMLALGWVKRVVDGLNPLEARVTDFRNSATNTMVSMLSQFGCRYEGAIAFSNDPDYLNSLGLIPAYESVLNRAREFSIDAGQNYGPTNDALLNISSRLATFYLALANESYADAVDPTIGFSTMSAEYGNMAPSVFAFQNQVDSLLEEELALMRGRDDSAGSTRNSCYYNRLIWNFTQGEGEVAYAQNYNITDQDSSGLINAGDAKIMYPQGHGDAWGHYLQSISYYYRLLRHESYSWVPRVEFQLVAGNPIMVDYLDERKFASIAAARAKTGAEILDLTYRKFYTDDPAGQWQGYKDTSTDRAWGVDEWARRAGQAAYFDWVTANAILPVSNPETVTRIHYVTGDDGRLVAETLPSLEYPNAIQKIDRSKVPELKSIATQFHLIQSKMTEVDNGINPLGLVKGVVPFDIDPVEVDAGNTHFEQIYQRAEKALANATASYDFANGYTQRLRQNQDTLEDFKSNLTDQERDYKNRLIEIFGYPYPDDIGAGKSYPDGYDGPDIFHYNYVNRTELTGGTPLPAISYKTYSVNYKLPADFWALGLSNYTIDAGTDHTVSYNINAQENWLEAPQSWITKRRAPGRVQQALSDMIVAKAAYDKAFREYESQLSGIDAAKTNLEERYGILAHQILLRDQNEGAQIGLDSTINALHATGMVFRRVSAIASLACDAVIEAVPDNVIAGVAAGGDILSSAKAAVKGIFAVITSANDIVADVTDMAEFSLGTVKERMQAGLDLKLAKSDASYEVSQLVKELENSMSDLDLKLMELYSLKEGMQQTIGNYQATLAEGVRLMDERAEKRAQSAAEIQEYRFQDLGFRVFRNDAIQKYRAQFDLATKYVYLAATAYDYETNLLGSASGAGRKFLGEIARQRTLGVLSNGIPQAGFPGLADTMARLSQNFSVYKTQLGFNNPQTETTPFSLRTELFRIKGDATSNSDWRDVLKDHKVDDLWKIPEFKRYCRPFAPESAGPQPGIVIRFPTTVTYGKNFFGWPLSGGDSAYSTSNFATRVRSVGLWFQNYDNLGLSSTPRVYLVPTGADVLRSPTGDGFATREWQVRDQKLPVPFPLGDIDLKNPDFIPVNDSLSDELSAIRRVSDFRAYPYSGAFDPGQATTDSRLIGRSVWNSQWMLIIPGSTLLFNKDVGLNTFINSVDDIKMFFQTYAYSGN